MKWETKSSKVMKAREYKLERKNNGLKTEIPIRMEF